MREVLTTQQRLSLGELPVAPEHGFVGRSRELLKAERLLEQHPYVLLRAAAGNGKTTFAADLARWLVATRRFDHAAFASLDKNAEAHSVLYALGSQLVANFESLAGQDAHRAWLEVERALRERRTLLILDKMDSVLSPEAGAPDTNAFEPEVLENLLNLTAKLNALGATLVFTSRQAMPSPFVHSHVTIGRLERREALDLVARAFGQQEQVPRVDDPGESDDEVTRLVDVVGCHARSLVLLAREAAESGVRNASERIGELMGRLQQRYPQDPDRSLYASVEPSLKRLPARMRKAIRPLGVFQGGGHLTAMAFALGVDPQQTQVIHEIAESLVRVGLAEPLEDGYLRLDPALGPLLLGEMSEVEQVVARDRWAMAMAEFTKLLSHENDRGDPKMAARMVLLELPNLLSALEHLGATASAELVMEVATSIESLLQQLGRPKALSRASRVRAAAARTLGEWNHTRFIAESQAVDRLLDTSRFSEAIAAARGILEQALAAGESAYQRAPYELAVAHFRLGLALRSGGDAEEALAVLREARHRFQLLASGGDQVASGMVPTAITTIGDCLRKLGRLDAAASAYEEAIHVAEEMGNARQVAVGKGQLGTVRMNQRRYDDALAAFQEARHTFEQFGESRSVAGAWHQIGMVHQDAERYDEAEKAYQAALRINVQIGNRLGEAASLTQLGVTYRRMGRLEDAVQFYGQAATTQQESNDMAAEGVTRSNLAYALFELRRYDDARREILRAVECKAPFGHAAEPWKTLGILSLVERAAGNAEAAATARQQASDAYLAYRRDGGENTSELRSLLENVAQAITDGDVSAAAPALSGLAGRTDLLAHWKTLILKLEALVRGERNPSVAADPDLDYRDAVELRLLLARVTPSPSD